MDNSNKIIIAVKLDRILYKRLRKIAEVQQVDFDCLIPCLLSDIFELVDGFSTHKWHEALSLRSTDVE